MSVEADNLARPFRLALRWAAGRDIPRHAFPDRAVDHLIRLGLLEENEEGVWPTAEGWRCLAAIERSGEAT